LRSALKFLDTGAFEKPAKVIHALPDFTRLTSSIPGPKDELHRRWAEAQRCVHIEAFCHNFDGKHTRRTSACEGAAGRCSSLSILTSATR
jgi:hypothetical protein